MTVKLNVRLPDVQIVQMDVLTNCICTESFAEARKRESVRCGGHVWQIFLTMNLVIFVHLV